MEKPRLGVGMAVRTDIRAGKETNVFEAAFFKLLDVLQKPTAWVYDRIIPPEHRQPLVLERSEGSGGGA
jgi:hypothetical protein